jgi:hypothetical protein
VTDDAAALAAAPLGARPDPWLADIVRCAEASFARWQEAHRNEETLALTFHGPDGSFYEGMRSVVDRLRDYHYERTKAAALPVHPPAPPPGWDFVPESQQTPWARAALEEIDRLRRVIAGAPPAPLPLDGFAADRPTGPRTAKGHALASRLRRTDAEIDWDAWIRAIEDAARLATPEPTEDGQP